MTSSLIKTVLGQHWIHEHNSDTVKYETLVYRSAFIRDETELMSYSLCVLCLSEYPSLSLCLCLSLTLHLFSVQTIVCFKGQQYKSIILAAETRAYHGLSEV